MTEVSELKLKLVGMEKEQREQEEKQRKAEVSVIHQTPGGPILSGAQTRENYPNVGSDHLINPEPGSRWVPETSVH